MRLTKQPQTERRGRRAPGSSALAAIVAAAALALPSSAIAGHVPKPAHIAGVQCDAAELGGRICFDKSGDVGAREIITNAIPADLARCEAWFTADRTGHVATCIASGGVLILAGRLLPHVSQREIDRVASTSTGRCIGRPMGPGKIDPSVACFVGGDLLLAGDAHVEGGR